MTRAPSPPLGGAPREQSLGSGVGDGMAVRQRPDDRRGDRTGPRISLGMPQFALLVAGLASVLTVIAIVVYPSAYSQYVQDVGIKRFERQYGFRSGVVAWREPGRDRQSVWGIVSVTSDGAFARAGVREGDDQIVASRPTPVASKRHRRTSASSRRRERCTSREDPALRLNRDGRRTCERGNSQ